MLKNKVLLIFFVFLLTYYIPDVYAQEGRKIPDKIAWEKDYPAVPSPENTSDWGKHIQRTMTLLATSTPEKRNTVRILFYGQSIVANKRWTDAVMAGLKNRFPHANIIYENRAIGGFSSQYLVGTSEGDMYPFYPDLVIFHVYGAHKQYQEIIHALRSRTTAEVAIVTDHLGAKEFDGKEFADPGDWKNFMRNTFVPAVAKEYNAQLIDITTPWKRYLKQNQLSSQALLKDGVHPNDHGCYVMSQLVERQLIYLPNHPDDEWKDMVKTYIVGKDIKFKRGKLTLNFEGNKVNVIAAENNNPAVLNVLVDGKKPSEFKSCYTYSRTSRAPGVAWPALLKVGFETRPLIEQWTLTIEEVNKLNSDFTFRVEGSRTGYDGKGHSLETFVSNSGRVVIEPWFWKNMQRDYEFKGKQLKSGFEITWSTKPLFTDQYKPEKTNDTAEENLTTLAQNLSNEEHILELSIVGNGNPAIKAIKVYQPPVKGKMEIVANPPIK